MNTARQSLYGFVTLTLEATFWSLDSSRGHVPQCQVTGTLSCVVCLLCTVAAWQEALFCGCRTREIEVIRLTVCTGFVQPLSQAPPWLFPWWLWFNLVTGGQRLPQQRSGPCSTAGSPAPHSENPYCAWLTVCTGFAQSHSQAPSGRAPWCSGFNLVTGGRRLSPQRPWTEISRWFAGATLRKKPNCAPG